jgi:hypothetical protein
MAVRACAAPNAIAKPTNAETRGNTATVYGQATRYGYGVAVPVDSVKALTDSTPSNRASVWSSYLPLEFGPTGAVKQLEETRTVNLTNVNPVILILFVSLVLAICIAVWMFMLKKRTQNLRSKFGPEYDKAIGEHRGRGNAESELQKRVERVAKFNIHPLKAEERSRYSEDWRREQSLFVDDPQAAVNHADTLVQDVMQRRGYPVGDFDQNASDLSVDHPRVVENYRIAHEIALRKYQGKEDTEDLRKAMVSYRALFEELMEQTVDKPEEITR